MLSDGGNILLIVIGFSLLVGIHELGHFLAARWAGIRVDAFAIGMGPTVVAFRRGMGWTLGSTSGAVERRFGAPPEMIPIERLRRQGVGETEYSLRLLPLGGFVRMKGQEDLHAIEDNPDEDAYPAKPVWKRMVVVSAGVVMNIILAVLLYVVAFMVGVRFEDATVGALRPGSASTTAHALDPGVAEGLRPGDHIQSVDGSAVRTFADVQIAVAMSRPGSMVQLEVTRPGSDRPLRFEATPDRDPGVRMRSIGIAPARECRLAEHDDPSLLLKPTLDQLGLTAAGVGPGWTLASVAGKPATIAEDLSNACQAGEGSPVLTRWSGPGGATAEATLSPVPALPELAPTDAPDAPEFSLLGLCPLSRIDWVRPESANVGVLKPGDVVLSFDGIRGPRMTQFRDLVRQRPSRIAPMEVLRNGKPVSLQARVDAEGRLDVLLTPAYDCLWMAKPIDRALIEGDARATPAASLEVGALALVQTVGGAPVRGWSDLVRELRAGAARGEEAVALLVLPDGSDAPRRVRLPLSKSDADAVRRIGWASPLPPEVFEPLMTTLTAGGNPMRAASMGFGETAKLATMTWLTIDRLARGSVPVDQLRGPVGIVHVGTRVADRGLTYLVFFLAMISVNLAVLNFLPLPIVDGGLFLYLAYEALRGRPPSVRFQNAATMAGLLLIGGLFLVTFYNDVMRLVG